jgi:hypothetical protein
MTVFIHIGLTKTGTTSIQQTMFRNADRLREEFSINYPGFAPNHMLIALPLLRQKEFRPLDHRVLRGHGSKEQLLETGRRALEQFASDADRYPTHVISAEQFYLLHHDSALALRSFFAGLGLPTKVIVYVRHPAERLSSLVSQKLRGGHESLRSFRVEDTVTPVIRTYSEVFGKENMIIRRFGDRYFVNGDLIDDFVTAFHGKPIAGLTVMRLNPSLSAPAVLLADQLFEIAPLVSGARGNERYLNRIAGPKFLASRAMVQAAVEAHRDCLAYLDTEFGIQFDDVDLSAFPEAVCREFSADALASIASILNEQSLTIARLTAAARRREERRLKNRVRKLLRLA